LQGYFKGGKLMETAYIIRNGHIISGGFSEDTETKGEFITLEQYETLKSEGRIELDKNYYIENNEIDIDINTESGMNFYTKLSDLGLIAPVAVGDIFNAMPDNSMAVIACEGREGNTEGAIVHVSDIPVSFGVLTIKKNNPSRFAIEYQNSLGSAPCNIKRWIGTLKGNDGTGLYWKEVTFKEDGALIYTSLADLGLDTTATLTDITRAMAKGSIIAIKVDAMANQSEYNNIAQGTVTIHKVEDARVQAILTEKSTGRTWVGTLGGNNTITGWRELALKTYTTLTELGLTADATMMDVISAIPNGGDALLGVTDFTNWQTIFPYKEGNDQFGRVFIQKGNDIGRTYIKWFRKDGTREALGILNINNNEFSGWNEIIKTYTTLAELKLTADATPSDVVRVMPAGSKALISTHEFTNYQTLFPYSVEADQYATLNVEKGYDTTGSRTIVTWVRKDASKIAYGGIDSNNTIRWWNEVILKGIGDIAPTTVTTFTLPDTVVNQTNNSRITYQVKNGVCCVAVQLALDAVSSAVTTWTNVATGFPKPSFNISQTINSERNSSEVPMAMRMTAGGTLQMIFNGTTNTSDWWTTTFTYPVAD
jgi:hypothetical protein